MRTSNTIHWTFRIFSFVNMPGGLLIQNLLTCTYLDIEGPASAGTHVVLRSHDQCHYEESQEWICHSDGSGYFYIKHKIFQSLVLAVMNDLPNCGNGLVLAYRNASSPGQRFKFERGLIVSKLQQPTIPMICLEAGQSGDVFINSEITSGSQATAQQWGTATAN